jgi:hypothetical protein
MTNIVVHVKGEGFKPGDHMIMRMFYDDLSIQDVHVIIERVETLVVPLLDKSSIIHEP